MPYLILGSHIVAVVAVISLIMKNNIALWLGKHALALGFVASLGAIIGSLFYSDVLGFAPCDLCWWQRIFIFPQVVLFAAALKKKDVGVFSYVVPLAIIASLISVYNLYIQMGGNPLIPCSTAASCTKVYVMAFGYISIPVMALTASVAFLILAWARKIYENHHA